MPRRLVVTMNRDEARARGPESSPKLHETQPSMWAGPLDGDSGGTWMGVNSHGVVACLLNGYFPADEFPPPTGDVPSRGGIIPASLPEGPIEDVETWFRDTFDAAPYPSFVLLLATVDQVVEYRWLRAESVRRSECEDDWTLVTSSGWKPDEVRSWRMARFEAWREAGCALVDGLPAFHLEHDPEKGAYSILLDRPWSRTRSITQAAVDASSGSIVLRYWQVDDALTLADPVTLHVPAAFSAAARC